MSKYKGWSDRQVLDVREKQIEYLTRRLQIAETAMAGAWSLTIIPGTKDIEYCLKSYRDQFPDAIGLWTGDTKIPSVEVRKKRDFKLYVNGDATIVLARGIDSQNPVNVQPNEIITVREV